MGLILSIQSAPYLAFNAFGRFGCVYILLSHPLLKSHSFSVDISKNIAMFFSLNFGLAINEIICAGRNSGLPLSIKVPFISIFGALSNAALNKSSGRCLELKMNGFPFIAFMKLFEYWESVNRNIVSKFLFEKLGFSSMLPK